MRKRPFALLTHRLLFIRRSVFVMEFFLLWIPFGEVHVSPFVSRVDRLTEAIFPLYPYFLP